jgi:hypothetical protein
MSQTIAGISAIQFFFEKPSERRPMTIDECFGYALRQAKAVLAHALPDEVWPGMWRLIWPDGRVSDMTTLTRCKDAGRAIAGGRHGSSGYHWKVRETSPSSAPMHLFGQSAPHQPPTNAMPPASPAGVSPAITDRDVAHG